MLDDAFFPELFVSWDEITPDEIAAFENALNEAQTEADMQRFIEEHPLMLIQQIGGGRGAWVIPQKRLGSEYVTDFMVAQKASDGLVWWAVELERPQALMFNKNGDPSGTLNHALRQIGDWRDWLAHNRDYATRPLEQSGLSLVDIDPELDGLIIIGRDADVDQRTTARRRRLMREHRVKIETYDWLLHQARERLAARERRLRRVADAMGDFLAISREKPAEKAIREVFGGIWSGWADASVVRGQFEWEGVELWPDADLGNDGIAYLRTIYAHGTSAVEFLQPGDWAEWIDHVTRNLDARHSLLVTEIPPNETLQESLTLEKDGIWYSVEWARLYRNEKPWLASLHILVHLSPAASYDEKKGKIAVAREVFERCIALDQERELEREREAELKVNRLSLTPGDVVINHKFGRGTVVSTSGSGAKGEAIIDFGEEVGVKHLILRYASLKKLAADAD